VRTRGRDAPVPVESGGTGHPVDVARRDEVDARERYRRLLNWALRLALIGVLAWLIATPLQSGATGLLV